MKSGGTQPVDLSNDISNVWDRCADASRSWDTAPRIGNPLVVGRSPGLLSDQKIVHTVARRSESGCDRSLSLTPSRPGRGYGVGPAAVKGGSTGFRHGDNTNNMLPCGSVQTRPHPPRHRGRVPPYHKEIRILLYPSIRSTRRTDFVRVSSRTARVVFLRRGCYPGVSPPGCG